MYRLPIEAKKQKILKMLDKLEEAGLVSKDDDYQALINSIAQVTIQVLDKLTHNFITLFFKLNFEYWKR